jgi:F420-non-reducing hydrogenase small subunit
MYIIQSGAVEISQLQGRREIVLALLEQGDFFGEMALFDRQPRSATVTALKETRLLMLTRKSLLDKIKQDPSVILHLMETLSRRVDNTNQLLRRIIEGDESIRNSLLRESEPHLNISGTGTGAKLISKPDLLEENIQQTMEVCLTRENCNHYQKGEQIFQQGDDGDAMYIVVEGHVEISQQTDNGKYVIAYLGPNDYMGELALIGNIKRTANAEAIQESCLLKIDKKEFLGRLKDEPELALFILQVLIHRLRRTTENLHSPKALLADDKIKLVTPIKKDKPLSLGIISLSTCNGCTFELVDNQATLSAILEKAEVTYCPLLMDTEKIGEVDIAIIDGMVRTEEDVETLKEIRNKSRHLIAWGTCACFGGIPAMANHFELEELIEESYSQAQDSFSYYLSGAIGVNGGVYQKNELSLLRRVWNLDDIVKVDYYLPGCPPRGVFLTDLLNELQGKPVEEIQAAIVCAECSRKPEKNDIECFWVFPKQEWAQRQCFSSKGAMCMGFLTRGGCQAPCPEGGIPCWGCRGPSQPVLKKLSAGENFERYLLDAVVRRSKLDAAEIKPVMNIIRSRTNNLINFFQNMSFNGARFR